MFVDTEIRNDVAYLTTDDGKVFRMSIHFDGSPLIERLTPKQADEYVAQRHIGAE